MSEAVVSDVPRLPQRLRALERANTIRRARAELKRRVASGELAARDVLLDPPEEAVAWALGELLLAQRAWGRMRMLRFVGALKRVGVYTHEMKPIGSLTERQRQVIARLLPG